MGLKQILPGHGQGGGGTGDPVSDEQLEQIGGVANDAKTLAQAAKTESAAAGAKADAAKTAADGYSTQITTATQKADAAKTAADAASAAAAAASGKADGVSGTASDAKTKAEAAQSAAATAGTKADAAKTTADGLDGRVTAAETKANTAKTAADAATAAAGTASTKADNAKTAADQAKAIAVQYDGRLNDVESTQGGYTQLIAEATATANEANTAALNAKQTADDLDDAIIAAGTKADTAKTTADAAKVSAAEAKVTAGQALTKATDAKTEADALGVQMDGVINTAETAVTKAEEAKTLANQVGANVTDIRSDVESLQDDAGQTSVTLDDLNQRMAAAETDIDALQAGGGGGGGPAYDDTAIKGRVTALESDNVTNKSDITTNKSDIAVLKGAAASAGNALLMQYLSVWGDSRTAQNYNSNGGLTSRGYAFWAEALSGRCRVDQKYNFGVSGNTIAQLYARMTADTANAKGVKPSEVPPSHAALLIGTNTISTTGTLPTTADVLAQINQCVDWLISKGHTVYVIAEWPRGITSSGNSVLPAANQKLMLGLVRELKKLAAYKKVTVIDVWPQMADPALGTAQPLANYLNDDGLHPSVGAAFITGKLLAKALEQNNARRVAFPPSDQEVYDATYNKEGCLFPNPMLKNTAGTGVLASGASGVAPDGMTVSPSVSTLTTTGSYVTVTDKDGNKRQAYRMVINGTAAAAQASVMLRVPSALRANSPWNGNILDGDVLEGGAEIIVSDGHVNLNAVSCNLVTDSTATSSLGGYPTGGTNGDMKWPDNLIQGFAATIRSPEYPIVSTYTKLQFEIRAFFVEAGQCTATIDILSAWVRKKANP